MYETHEARKLVFVVQWAVHGDGCGRRETRYTGRKAVFLQLVLGQAAPAMTAAMKDERCNKRINGKIGKANDDKKYEKLGDFSQCPMCNVECNESGPETRPSA